MSKSYGYLPPSTVCQDDSDVITIKPASLKNDASLASKFTILNFDMAANRYALEQSVWFYGDESTLKWLTNCSTGYYAGSLYPLDNQGNASDLAINGFNFVISGKIH
jgi:hypothetical protein